MQNCCGDNIECYHINCDHNNSGLLRLLLTKRFVEATKSFALETFKSTVKINPCFSSSHTCCLGHERETGGERKLVVFEDKPIYNHTNEKVSSRGIEMVIHMGIFITRECLLTRLLHFKFIALGSVRSSHLPFKMHYVGYVRASFNACRLNRNTLNNNQITLSPVLPSYLKTGLTRGVVQLFPQIFLIWNF